MHYQKTKREAASRCAERSGDRWYRSLGGNFWFHIGRLFLLLFGDHLPRLSTFYCRGSVTAAAMAAAAACADITSFDMHVHVRSAEAHATFEYENRPRRLQS